MNRAALRKARKVAIAMTHGQRPRGRGGSAERMEERGESRAGDRLLARPNYLPTFPLDPSALRAEIQRRAIFAPGVLASACAAVILSLAAVAGAPWWPAATAAVVAALLFKRTVNDPLTQQAATAAVVHSSNAAQQRELARAARGLVHHPRSAWGELFRTVRRLKGAIENRLARERTLSTPRVEFIERLVDAIALQTCEGVCTVVELERDAAKALNRGDRPGLEAAESARLSTLGAAQDGIFVLRETLEHLEPLLLPAMDSTREAAVEADEAALVERDPSFAVARLREEISIAIRIQSRLRADCPADTPELAAQVGTTGNREGREDADQRPSQTAALCGH